MRSPAEHAEEASEIERMELALKELNERDVKIIRMRFGIGQKKPMTLEEVGKKVHLSRERIRQIEIKMLKALRRALSGNNGNHHA